MADPTTNEPQPEPQPEPIAPPQRESIIDAIADLLQLASQWLRQELGAAVREKAVLPMQRVGFAVAAALAAGCLIVTALIFVAVGLFMLLGEAISYPAAFLAVGGAYLLAGIVFLAIKGRMTQR